MGSDQALQAAAVDGGSQLQCVPTIDAEVKWLLQRVDLGDCRHALEPFNGMGAISAALRAAGLAQVRTNDLASSRPSDLHEDASQPGFYRRCAQKFGAPSVIVTSPWFSVLDIALPVIVESATVVACIHVPGHYLASELGPRYAYLRRLQQCGRLVVLFGLPRGPLGWLSDVWGRVASAPVAGLVWLWSLRWCLLVSELAVAWLSEQLACRVACCSMRGRQSRWTPFRRLPRSVLCCHVGTC